MDLSGFIDHYKDLLLQLPQVKMFHCFKEANCCADALARLGSSQDNVSLHFVSPLLYCTLVPLVYVDLLGMYRSRLCLATVGDNVG